jgi:hypothetical protein
MLWALSDGGRIADGAVGDGPSRQMTQLVMDPFRNDLFVLLQEAACMAQCGSWTVVGLCAGALYIGVFVIMVDSGFSAELAIWGKPGADASSCNEHVGDCQRWRGCH